MQWVNSFDLQFDKRLFVIAISMGEWHHRCMRVSWFWTQTHSQVYCSKSAHLQTICLVQISSITRTELRTWKWVSQFLNESRLSRYQAIHRSFIDPRVASIIVAKLTAQISVLRHARHWERATPMTQKSLHLLTALIGLKIFSFVWPKYCK